MKTKRSENNIIQTKIVSWFIIIIYYKIKHFLLKHMYRKIYELLFWKLFNIWYINVVYYNIFK